MPGGAILMETMPDQARKTDFRMNAGIYVSVALISAAVIALQICVMRIFAVGSWTHFGSMVISLAMLGFGLSSVVIFSFKGWFERNWKAAAGASLLAFGPVTVAANLVAQAYPFNAVFLVSDPAQKWRLALNFVLYLLPFLCAALFLGIIFLKSRTSFNRAYFADLAGAGGGGAVILAALYLLAPEKIVLVPLVLWVLACMPRLTGRGRPIAPVAALALPIVTVAGYLGLPALTGTPPISVSQYKGISYARNFPDARRIYRNVSPFGDLQIYRSSYMHFAPGLSDNAAFNLPELPANIYAGMYVDGDGPEGIMRQLPPKDDGYYRYLPAFYPYVLEKAPKTFVVQFGGDISTRVALQAGSRSVTAAESNPAVVAAFRSRMLKTVTGDILASPRLRLVNGDGRLFLEHSGQRYDVIDLSLADSVGLSNPGGFSVVEKYLYTRQAFLSYMRALSDHGILAVTVWNKEEPPKSVLKLYATIAAAARDFDPGAAAKSLFVASSYLSTTTVLYKKGGFTAADADSLRAYTRSMSFDEIYSPGYVYDTSKTASILADYRASIYGSGRPSAGGPDAADDAAAPPPDGESGSPQASGDAPQPMPATTLGRLAWHYLVHRRMARDRPPICLRHSAPDGTKGPTSRATRSCRTFPGRWTGSTCSRTTGAIWCSGPPSPSPLSRLSLWSCCRSSSAGSLRRSPGKFGAIVYFACLGLGYIMVEVGPDRPVHARPVEPGGLRGDPDHGHAGRIRLRQPRLRAPRGPRPPVAARHRCSDRRPSPFLCPRPCPGPRLDRRLSLRRAAGACARSDRAARLPHGLPDGDRHELARAARTRSHVRLGVGVNGCFSVIGAAAVPLVATTFGLDRVLEFSAVAYSIAAFAFIGLLS